MISTIATLTTIANNSKTKKKKKKKKKMTKHSNTVLMITTGVFLLVRRFVGRTPAGRANLLKAFPQKTGQYRDTFSSIISNVVSSTASTRARRCFLPVGPGRAHSGHRRSERLERTYERP